MNKRTYLSSLQETLHKVFEQDPQVFTLGEDILDPYGGAFKVTKGLSTKFPERVMATPICEASCVGVATGLALRGIKAIVEIMFGDFLLIAADQIVNHAAKFAMMYDHKVSVPLVIRTPMGGGRGYGPVHSQCLEKMFAGIPGLSLVAPSHYHDPGEELFRAIYANGPVLFLEHKLLYPARLAQSTTIGSDQGYNIVAVSNFKEDRTPDIIIVAYGGVSPMLEELMLELVDEEIYVTALLPALISPISSATYDLIASIVEQCGRVLVVEEGSEGFGWGAEISSRLYERLFNKLSAPIACVGGYPSLIPTSFELEQEVVVNKSKIEQALMGVLSQ